MRVALLGTGLIGGSIGLALRRLDDVEEVVAYDLDPAVREMALERGAATRSEGSPQDAVAGADVIFVAAPVGSIPDLVSSAAPGYKGGAVVTDVGSTKSRLVLEIAKSIPDGVSFVGGHPMAGTEEEGIAAADAGLFEGCWWILTPTERVGARAYGLLHGLLSRIGARVMALDAARHDDLMAVISHLPHLTATTLMNLAAERGEEHAGLLSLAAGGFRDVTRVAASNPDIWLDICEENGEAIAAVLREFAGRLLELGDLEKELIQALGVSDRSTFVAFKARRRSDGRSPT